MARDVTRTFLLPYLSPIGPRTSMLNARTSMNRYSDMFMTDSEVRKSAIIVGSPDRYMSVEMGPNMLRMTISSIRGRRPSLVSIIQSPILSPYIKSRILTTLSRPGTV